MSQFFEGSACSENVKHGKPDPEVFLKAAQILSLNPNECAIFEDSPHGIEAGKRAGMKTVALCTSYPSNCFMDLKPDMVVLSLAEIVPAQVQHLFD